MKKCLSSSRGCRKILSNLFELVEIGSFLYCCTVGFFLEKIPSISVLSKLKNSVKFGEDPYWIVKIDVCPYLPTFIYSFEVACLMNYQTYFHNFGPMWEAAWRHAKVDQDTKNGLKIPHVFTPLVAQRQRRWNYVHCGD